MGNIKEFGRQAAAKILNAVFPQRCVLCGRVIGPEKEDGLCGLCRWQDYRNARNDDAARKTEQGRCSLIYEDQLQRAIYKMKYMGCKGYGIRFARWMAAEGSAWARQMGFDRMTAVPLAKKRLRSRGYNQAEVIARELSRLCRVPYSELLIRRKETKRQMGLGGRQRGENLKGAFEALDCSGMPKRICLVDDIYTTGSTAAECIRVLKEKWPDAEVWYWVLAYREPEKISGNSSKN